MYGGHDFLGQLQQKEQAGHLRLHFRANYQLIGELPSWFRSLRNHRVSKQHRRPYRTEQRFLRISIRSLAHCPGQPRFQTLLVLHSVPHALDSRRRQLLPDPGSNRDRNLRPGVTNLERREAVAHPTLRLPARRGVQSAFLHQRRPQPFRRHRPLLVQLDHDLAGGLPVLRNCLDPSIR